MSLTPDIDSILPWMTSLEHKHPVHCRSEFPASELNSLATKIGKREGYSNTAELLSQSWSPQFLNFLLSLLNDESTSIRTKLATLLALVELSKTPEMNQREQLLLPIALQLDVGFVNMLEDKVKAAQEFGTMLGRQHEYVVVLLMRCTNYVLTGRDLLQDFFNGNRSLFFQVVLGILKVTPYEVEIKVNCLKVLYEISLPQTYFSSTEAPPSPNSKMMMAAGDAGSAAAAGGESTSNSATDFLDHMDTLLGVAIGCNALKTLCDIVQSLISNHNKAAAAAACGGGGGAAQLAACVRYFSLLYCNFYVFTSNAGNNGSQWRESMVTSNSAFLGDVLFGFMIQTAELLSNTSSDAHLSSALLLALEACSTCTALSVFGVKSQTALSTLREKATHMSTAVLTSLSAAQTATGSQLGPNVEVSSTVVLFAKLLQLQINADTLVGNDTRSSSRSGPSAEGAAAAEGGGGGVIGVPQKPAQLELFRCVVGQVGKLTDPHDMRLLSRLVVNCSSSLPLLAKKHKTFDIILETVESYAEKLGALQGSGPSTSSLVGGDEDADDGSEDAEDDDIDAALVEMDEKTAQLENDSGNVHGDMGEEAGATPSTKKSKKSKLEKKVKKEKRKKVQRRKQQSIHPSEFVCRWSGALMKNPVKLPSGNWFELSALEQVIETIGHVDPVTGESFDSHLNVDNQLQKKIQRYLFELQMQQEEQNKKE